MHETIGKRIASLRQKNGWTQQSLADRLAISRVAVSHIEMDLTIPSERTITLMAGIFKLAPIELVEGTTYPRAKAERLPAVTNCYTELELQLTLLGNAVSWIKRLDSNTIRQRAITEVLHTWTAHIEEWKLSCLDDHERDILLKISQILEELRVLGGHTPAL